jgi:hypothetical protein
LQSAQLCAGFAPWLVAKYQRLASKNDLEMASNTDNPFTPRGTLSRERLERYVRGELSPAERHEVELHMEVDPLLREAVDGLRMPGALTGLDGLEKMRPAALRSGGRTWLIAGVTLVALVIAFWSTYRSEPPVPAPQAVPSAEHVVVPVTPEQQAAFTEELIQATALPESLRSAYRGVDHFVQLPDTADAIVRTDPPAHVDALPVEPVIAPPIDVVNPQGVPAPKPSRQLMFFFDLKLVHPKELYPVDPVLELADGSVDARYSDAQAKTNAGPLDNAVPYDRFFKIAMGKFSRGDRQGCLEDMFVVLEDHPEDVNALFYAGLCCYDLGMFPRAASLLDRARQHEVDTFIEEAEWYHALAEERVEGRGDALPLFNAVVERSGFYAERARAHLAEK